MADHDRYDQRLLAEPALRNAAAVTPEAPRFLRDPIGGTSDAASLAVGGGSRLPGQVDETEFFTALAEAALIKLGVSGPGDERLPGAAAGIGEVATGMYRAATLHWGGNWQDIVERLIGPVDRRAGDTVRSVVERLLNVVDVSGYLDLVRIYAEAQREEASAATTEGMDQDELWTILLPIATKLVDPDVMKAAKELEDRGKSNSSRADGIIVHQWVQAYYRKKNANSLMVDRDLWVGGQKLGTVGALAKASTKQPFPVVELLNEAFTSVGRQGFLGAVKPDILDTDLRALYEIKPRSRSRLAVLQMVVYVLWYNGLLTGKLSHLATSFQPILPGGRMIGPGPDLFRAPLVAPATGDQYAAVGQDPRVPGLIYYDVFKCADCSKIKEQIAAYEREADAAASTSMLIAMVLAGVIILGVLVVNPVVGDELAFGGMLAQTVRILIARLATSPGKLILVPP